MGGKMENILILISILLIMATSLLNFFSYRLGLRDGMDINKGKALQPPIQMPKVEFKTTEKSKEDIITEGLNNLMTYDGSPASKKE
jgi:hypothetical protein